MKNLLRGERLKEFIFEQKCIPWKITCFYSRIRNNLFDLNTSQHWNLIWSEKKRALPPHLFYPETYDKIISMIPIESKVVDIGCGIGILMKRLKEEKLCDVFGIDISQKAIETLREKGLSGIVSRVPPVSLPTESFDVALSTELLEHLKNPIVLLGEMARVIRARGLLILSVPDSSMEPHSVREHLKTFDEKKLRNMLHKVKEIQAIKIFKVWDMNQHVYRLILKGQKCG